MLLKITTTHSPPVHLGFLLHKNPNRVHEMDLPFGRAVMFYPEVSEARATFALLLDIDLVALVRSKNKSAQGLFDQCVSDRLHVASSFLSVAIVKLLRNALGGSSKERPELADTPIQSSARVLPVPVRGAEGLVTRLFEPLGYDVVTERIALDDELGCLGERSGQSPYVTLNLSGRDSAVEKFAVAHLCPRSGSR